MLKCGTGFSVCLCDYALESDEFLVFISNFVFHQHSPGIACFAIKCRFLDFQGEVGGCIFHNVAEMQNISQIEKNRTFISCFPTGSIQVLERISLFLHGDQHWEIDSSNIQWHIQLML